MIAIKLLSDRTILRYAWFVLEGVRLACDGKCLVTQFKSAKLYEGSAPSHFYYRHGIQVLQYLLLSCFAQFILCRQQNAFCMNPRMTHQMTTKLPCHMHNKRNQVCDIKIIRSLSFVSEAYVEFNETGSSWWWLLSLETLHHVVINLDV